MSDVLCVLCRRHPIAPQWRPFCSQRCQLQDLANWADGRYTVPAEPVLDDDEAQHEPGQKENGKRSK